MGSHPAHGPVHGPVDPDVTPDDVRTSQVDHALVRDRLDVLGVIAAGGALGAAARYAAGAFAASSRTSTTATRAPSRAKSRAVAWPMRDEAPVTRTVRAVDAGRDDGSDTGSAFRSARGPARSVSGRAART